MTDPNRAEWKDSLSVGNAELDAQHKGLLNLVNDVYDAVQGDRPHRPLEALLDETGRYAEIHFKTEERLMAESGYPGLEEHRKSHEAFRDLFGEIRSRSREDQALDLFFFLKEWLLGHIGESDADYAPWLKQGRKH